MEKFFSISVGAANSRAGYIDEDDRFISVANAKNSCAENIPTPAFLEDARKAGKKNAQEEIASVITCPFYYGGNQLAEWINRFEKAGIHVKNVVSESIAIAHAYVREMNKVRKSVFREKVLIFDLGERSCTCSIVSIQPNIYFPTIKIVAAEVDHNLGGRAWSQALAEYFLREFCLRTGVDEGSLEENFFARLNCLAEGLKIRLSTVDSVTAEVSFGEQTESIFLSRGQFEQDTKSYLEDAIRLIEKTLFEVGLTMEKDINGIVLAGGGSLMPQVKERLQDYGKKVYGWEYSDKLAVIGGAIVAKKPIPVQDKIRKRKFFGCAMERRLKK